MAEVCRTNVGRGTNQGEACMRISINSHSSNGDFLDDDNTDQVDFDKKQWHTLLFVLTLLGGTVLKILMLA